MNRDTEHLTSNTRYVCNCCWKQFPDHDTLKAHEQESQRQRDLHRLAKLQALLRHLTAGRRDPGGDGRIAEADQRQWLNPHVKRHRQGGGGGGG